MKRTLKGALPCSQVGRVFVWIALALAFNASFARAATYYVSPDGNDGGKGTLRAPWKSVAKVDAAALLPGDSVLFKRGGNWRESLVVSTSGAPGKPLTFGDYGVGAKPQFWGSDVLKNADFFPAGEGVFAYHLAAPLGALLEDHRFAFDAAKADSDWWEWKDGVLLLHTKRDPRGDGRIYTACVREDILNSNGHDHLIFRNLACDESAKADGGYGVRVMNSTDVLVQGCEVRHAGKHHFGCINSTGVIFRDCLAAFALPHQPHGGTSAFVAFGDNAQLPRQTALFENCAFKNTEDAWDGGHNAYVFVTHGPAMGEVMLQNMTSQGAPWELDNRESGAHLSIRGSVLENNRLELYGRNIVVDGLAITGSLGTVDISASDCVLQNMTISGTNLGTAWYQTAVLSRGANNTVRACHIALAADAPEYNTPLAVSDAGTPFSYSDNTLTSRGAEIKDWTPAHNAQIVSHANIHRMP